MNRIFVQRDRSPQVLRSLQQLYRTGRLANIDYLSILPLDQGIEHSATASFNPNPIYFNPENIINLAISGAYNAVAAKLCVLSMTSRKYAHQIPLIVKLNHNELMSYLKEYNQTMFASVDQA